MIALANLEPLDDLSDVPELPANLFDGRAADDMLLIPDALDQFSIAQLLD